ncbi:hypothetical protein GCM10010123_12600 [Pilimelia anulata]|uniref:Uncharacterized protein n=1 Tax=Pilimelia anulata TaxID=53371 RepID=A0A8J3B3E4_9ACTN|nr:hypothetical protein [Pilimelia anulata]GGJ84444.1 hypothetical protein GCM10010123_12600 [Pilimelia anulata]
MRIHRAATAAVAAATAAGLLTPVPARAAQAARPGAARPAATVLVDRNCADGAHILTVEDFRQPSELPDIQDLIKGYSKNNYMAFITGVLSRRYPTGNRIIEQGGGKAAVDRWLHWKDSAPQVLGSLGTVVHEIGHGIDKSTPQNWYYVTRTRSGTDVAFTAPGMHGRKTTSSSPMYSLERSLLLADDENKKRPPSQRGTITTSREFGSGSHGTDKNYAETYLNGDPADSKFDSGDQGFNSLVEEWNQYINSFAVAHYTRTGNSSGRSSDRHALLTYLWWVERYLRKIRVEQPAQHKYLLDNRAWQDLVLSLWGRSWVYLKTDFPGMEPDSGQVTELVRQPHLLDEIQYLRTARGCTNPQELYP